MALLSPTTTVWPSPPAAPPEEFWWTLVARTLARFLDELDRAPPVPSGGSAGPVTERDQDPDLELLQKVRAGYPHETRTYGELVSRHWPRVWRVCQAVLLDAHDAEEAAQDTFLKAHRYLPSFRGESRFTTWLSRIAHHAAIDRLRSRRRERSARADLAEDSKSALRITPMEPHGQGADVRRVRAALAELSPEDRSMLILRDVEGYSYEDMAVMLAVEQGAARMRLTRARSRLRRAFERTPVEPRRWPWQR